MKIKFKCQECKALANELREKIGAMLHFEGGRNSGYHVGPYFVGRNGVLIVEERDVDWSLMATLVESERIKEMGLPRAAKKKLLAAMRELPPTDTSSTPQVAELPQDGDGEGEDVSMAASEPSVTEPPTISQAPAFSLQLEELPVRDEDPPHEREDEIAHPIGDVSMAASAPSVADSPTISQDHTLSLQFEELPVRDEEPPHDGEDEMAPQIENVSMADDEPEDFSQNAEGTPVEIDISIDGHTGRSLRNLVAMIYTRGPLLSKASGGILGVDRTLAETLEEIDPPETASDFCAMLDRYAENHKKTGLRGILISPKQITFTGFSARNEAEAQSYRGLVSLMNQMALKSKRLHMKEAQRDNERYSLRIWLLRLGFIGDEYKQLRRDFMKRLEGNSAWRTPEQVQEFNAERVRKYRELHPKRETRHPSTAE